MAGHPEQGERLDNPSYPMLTEENLYFIFEDRSPATSETSLQFVDGSEFLSLIHLWTRRQSYGIHFDDPELDKQFDFLDLSVEDLDVEEGEDPWAILQEKREAYPIAKLNRILKEHWKLQTKTFESKVKHRDRKVTEALGTLVANQKTEDNEKGYEFGPLFDEVRPVIAESVVEQKGDRTFFLLEDFNEGFAQLGDTTAWMEVNQMGRRRAARLAGFIGYGTGLEAAVEPLVYGIDGQIGRLPEQSYVVPQLYFRVQGGELVSDQI
jgi:hypothetical protein